MARVLTAPVHEVPDDAEAVFEYLLERKWTDGLPVIPPTPERVERMLAGTRRDPGEVVARLNPRQGDATVERVAINAVMAGCAPAYLPVVLAAVEAVGLSHRRDYPAVKLSGGEKQRVAIARALVADPQVLFADEPTGNLDSKSGAQVMALLDELHRAGRTIIVVTHETATAEHAERIIRIRDGQILSDEKVATRRRAADDNGDLGK